MNFQTHRIEVLTKAVAAGQLNAQESFVRLAHFRGITSLSACSPIRIYYLHGDFSPEDLTRIAQIYLADPVTETFTIDHEWNPAEPLNFVDVMPLPGVTNSVAENLMQKVRQAGIGTLSWVNTGTRYWLQGDLTEQDLAHIASDVLANEVVQFYAVNTPLEPTPITDQTRNDIVETISLAGDDDALAAMNAERRLALDPEEMRVIQAYFAEEGRDPTDLELETLAQTWSEHCIHKTFRADITYTENGQTEVINGLLKTYIRAATDELDKPWLRSVFVDNAGIIRFDDQYDIAFKVETHNHPSAIEPFGGSNTGVGGVVRDVLGVSAKPIANTDILCFGMPETPIDEIPEGTLHPQQIAEGVIHGVEDYGNKMGIPTVNGAVLYDPGYTANPLVFCGCLGILPHGSNPTSVQPGDYIIVLGGLTGRDGLRGATFSSMEMDATTGAVAGSSVQIGNPITEKQVQEVIIRAREEKLYNAITDCGAGGLSSAVGEMGETIGATVQLQAVPLKYVGLQPWEVWLSEAQERMVMSVSPDKWERLQEVCAGQDVEVMNIGVFEPTGDLQVYNGDMLVGKLSMAFLHDGIPTRQLDAEWVPPQVQDSTTDANPFEALTDLLAHPNIRSKQDIVRQYDHEVQGGTSVKPYGGVGESAPNDGAVLVPVPPVAGEAPRGVVLSSGVCPQYTELDPYAMAWAAVDEAMRNAVAVGVDPDQVAILDNFCWGNPKLPDRLGSLVKTTKGCYDAALAYGTPFISGKDSLNNEYADSNGNRHAIPGTLLISAVGIVPDATRTATSDFKAAGNPVYVVGETGAELGGSHYGLVTGQSYGSAPQPVENALGTLRLMYRAIANGWVAACHDVSEGGLAVALAEMCIGGELGANISLDTLSDELDASELLYSESLTRFVVEVNAEHREDFAALMAETAVYEVGSVSADAALTLSVRGQSASYDVTALSDAWQGTTAATPVTTEPVQNIAPAVHTTPPKVLILHANGTNRDHDVARACELAGGAPEIVHMNQLRAGEKRLADYGMLVVPGGFSYGDDLGAGRLWAVDLQAEFAEQLHTFADSGRPVIGICNGFQTLVKAGLLPGDDLTGKVTLTYNERGHFECRWVYLQPNPNSPSLFTQGLGGWVYCPVAHGEGRVQVMDDETLHTLQAENLDALHYVSPDGSAPGYPANPNGSVANIAGLTNRAGNVFGLMPHPENHIFPWQHPRFHRGEAGGLGLNLFINGVNHAG